tara:strand:+ start:1327 stop:2280 length:954 start_codon:yes stop_codon:yes gene_type:complete
MSAKKNLDKFVLGSAQFGMQYGINNSIEPSIDLVTEILKQAIDAGITKIDTARAYGNSELILGNFFSTLDPSNNLHITTKLSPLSEFDEKHSQSVSSLKKAIDNSLRASIENLQIKTIDCLMLHRASHLFQNEGIILEELSKYKEVNLIRSIGVSVQTPDELELVLAIDNISQIQMPFNILDSRWVSSIELIKKEKKNRQIKIFTRSAFLQGLLLSDSREKWSAAHALNNYRDVLSSLKSFQVKFNRGSLSDLLINYVIGHDWIDGVVIGVDNSIQLLENIEIFQNKVLSSDELEYIDMNKPKVSKRTLNPAIWKNP